ncbi:heme-binding protein [Microbacterium sp.]|uniref:GlcG/HbpS family heme-binding protein n=1 Tax=Microbacterium sp. TaxID=51671 RepID=UPI0027330A01|nr:heme-binding protein [Microbacterium sp.]MDP3949581.1 heme-binding protein [Microbacterium sp.]
MTLSLETGRQIAQLVHAAAGRLHLRPLTVVVLDSGGHVVVAERSDASPIGRFEIARGKAYGALALGMNSRAIMERGELQPQFVASATAALDGRVIPVPGGVLVDDASGRLVGAVGVSGDTSDNDESVAMEAIAAVGLEPRGRGHDATGRPFVSPAEVSRAMP